MRAKHLPEGDVEEVVRGILQYLLDHPDAKDSVKGILNWWRPSNPRGWYRGSVKNAVRFLAAKGWLTDRVTTSGDEIYGADQTRLDEIKNYIARSGKKDREIR